MKSKIILAFISTIFLVSCSVVFISGYDPVIDDTATKLKRDFNVFFKKLSRAINNTDPSDQKFENFQDYYDNMEVDLKTISDRSLNLEKHSDRVKTEVENIQKIMFEFRDRHKNPGFKDLSPPIITDDHHTDFDVINTSINALLKLQEELKTTGKLKK
jgi:hypothetical protein